MPLSSTGHNIVVVKEAAAQPNKSNDTELMKLQVCDYMNSLLF